MTSNPEPIVQHLQHEFQNLRADVTGPEARSQTAYTVELSLFRRLLGLGAALLRLFCVTRAAGSPSRAGHGPRGDALDRPGSAPDDGLLGLWQSGLRAALLHRPRADWARPARRRVEPAGPRRCRPAAGVGGLGDDRRVRPREPDGAGTHPGALAQRARPADLCHRDGSGCGWLLCAASGADRPTARRRDSGGAGRWQRGADGAAVPPEAARAPGQGAEARQEEGSCRHRALHDCPLATHPPGGGGRPVAGRQPPGAGGPPAAGQQRTAGHPGGESGRQAPAGAAGGSARGAPERAAGGATPMALRRCNSSW